MFLLVLFASIQAVFSATIIYEAFDGSSTPANWQISGTDDNGAKDDMDYFNSGQGFLQLTKEANNEVASAFYTGNSFSNVGWTLTAEVRIAASAESQDGEGITFCWVDKSLVDAKYVTDGNYNFMLGALGPIQGAPTNLNLLGFEFDHLYNPGDSKSDEYAHVVQLETTSFVHLTNGAKDFSNRGGTPNTEYYLNNGWIKFKLVCWQDGSDIKLSFWWTKDTDGGTFDNSRTWVYNYTTNGISYPTFDAYFGITAATNTNKRSSH